jgi:predicted O-linked N-acetylglucosamine transferase (SPINDLY family)
MDVDGYVRKAVTLARDATERERLRAFLDGHGRDSTLFDTAATTRALEEAYHAMASQYRHQVRAPIDIGLPPPSD